MDRSLSLPLNKAIQSGTGSPGQFLNKKDACQARISETDGLAEVKAFISKLI